MLEPREADIPALFLVFVVLPLVAYVLLGKWSEASKKRERVSLLSQLAAEEAFRAESMAVADVIPPVSYSKNGLHACARCFSPATTRCSRCKSVRYCSGKCQIIHWREVHREECLQLEPSSSSSSPKGVPFGESFHEKFLLNDSINSQYFGCKMEQILAEEAPTESIIYPSISTGVPAKFGCASVDTSQNSILERKTADKRASRKSNRELLRKKDGVTFDSFDDNSSGWPTQPTSSNVISSKEAFMEHKSRNGGCHLSEEENPRKQNVNISDAYIKGQATSRNMVHENDMSLSQHGNIYESRSNSGLTCSSYSSKSGTDVHEIRLDFLPNGGNSLKGERTSNDETAQFKCAEVTALKACVKAKRAPYSLGTKVSKLPKSTMEVSGEQYFSEIERQGQIAEDSKVARMRDISTQGSNGMSNLRIMKMMGLKKPKTFTRQDIPEVNGHRPKTKKVLFPYDEFVKYFQCGIFDLSPRGLLNCGNSCYANAVLQCLTCTKPLIIYLLRRSHSRACCGKDWCLMCELEQHVMMLQESGGPLSPSRILFHMRSINCQIGDGSQEDAHEFLRLLVTSMQSICLEGLGGENKVDPRLQETTFIQHTFGGHLRSKVKCLRCHHESERYENIMDLTLEIFGWVESLEDALTQFTTPEDLDGENMYRCGRCAAYVRARKQLSIHEAPNILTIVLKRFQEGKYGKINKCITFPDMLDMIPFMTGTGDIPPLYLLYAVVVHLDTQNASFSGHYVAYVKDMRGNWFKIDDTEVQPVSMSQVMMEGAYILFYMRSCPRPQRAFGKAIRQQVPNFENQSMSKAQKSRPGQSKHSSQFVSPEHLTDDIRPDISNSFANSTSNDVIRSSNGNVLPMMETYGEPIGMEFSDATSSDWSLFTSSDEASFTTESTRDSFSTVDYADGCNIDPISSIFNNLYAPEHSRSSVSCRKFSNSRPHTRFVSKEMGLMLDSYLSTHPIDRVQRRNYSKQVSDSPTEHPSPDSRCSTFVRYGSNPIQCLDRTSDSCKLQSMTYN